MNTRMYSCVHLCVLPVWHSSLPTLLCVEFTISACQVVIAILQHTYYMPLNNAHNYHSYPYTRNALLHLMEEKGEEQAEEMDTSDCKDETMHHCQSANCAFVERVQEKGRESKKSGRSNPKKSGERPKHAARSLEEMELKRCE